MKTFALRDKGSETGKLFAPTKQEKLIYIASKLGYNNVEGMQGTSRNLFDTAVIQLGPTAARQTFNFFDQTTNKAKAFSNFQNGQLLAGESLMLEKINVELLQLTSADLTSEANIIISSQSLSMSAAAQNIAGGLMTINIGNSNVCIDYNMNELLPWNNPYTTGIAAGGTGPFTGCCEITMEAPPVLPQQTRLVVSLSLPAYPILGGAGTFWALRVTVGRFGSIYAPKTTL